MQDAFLFDADGDEDIIEKDHGQLLNAGGDVATPEQVHEMFMEVDDEDGGGPRLSTFACVVKMEADRMKEHDQEEEIIEAFKVFDADAIGSRATSCGAS